jgi:hypothetical protein
VDTDTRTSLVGVLRSVHAKPPPVPVTLDLDRWLEPGGQPWSVPVPAPFALRGAQLVGFPGEPEHDFDPREVPWLASDFAHVVAGIEAAPGKVQDAALAFANRYGVTGPWAEQGAPRDRPVFAMVREALELRQVLRALLDLQPHREGSGYRVVGQDTENARKALGIVRDFLASVPMPELAPGLSLETATGNEVELAMGLDAGYRLPLDLLTIMRLQVLSDLMAGREVRECPYRSARTGEPCGKLFVWPEKSGQEHSRSRLKPQGQAPTYCSNRHAATAAQWRHRQKKKKEKEAG